MSVLRRLSGLLLALVLMALAFAASGCAPGSQAHTIGNDVWTWERRGSTEQITLNEKLFAVIQSGAAHVTLPPDGRAVTVLLGKDGEPVSVKATWGITLSHGDYALMSTAFGLHKGYEGQGQTGPLGWTILLLLVVGAGLLLFLYAGRLVNSWKLGGIFSGHDTAKSLLVFKAAGVLLMTVGGLLLLVVLF